MIREKDNEVICKVIQCQLTDNKACFWTQKNMSLDIMSTIVSST